MEEKKKKKLTLSVSSKTSRNVPNYVKSRQKTSVLIEKKPARRWGEKKFQSRDNNLTKPKSTDNFFPKKTPINRNVNIRKLAEERATNRFKNLKWNLFNDYHYPLKIVFDQLFPLPNMQLHCQYL